MTVFYEWDVEEIADDDLTANGQDFAAGDIMGHAFQTSYKDCISVSVLVNKANDVNSRLQVVLVRDDDKGRTWAYIEEGNLPEFFIDAWGNDASKVPKRFHDEVKKNSK